MKKLILKNVFLLSLIIPITVFSQDKLKISDINKDNYEITQLMFRKQYIDRKYKIQKFPSFLLGAKLIMTANDDKSSTGEDFLSFSVNRNVSVFVAHWGTIKVVPKWLKDSYERTDLTLNSGEDDYILYKKDFPSGNISLGGNIESKEEHHAMYSVIISEQLDIPEIIEYATKDYKSLLHSYETYEISTLTEIPSFKYQNPNDSILIQLRNELELYNIVENKDEISQIIDLMKWANKRIEHNGSNNMRDSRTMNIISGFDKTGKGVNCRAMATVLNDIYLALGFKSRIISCMPHEDYDTESHVTNLVFSKSLNKWIYMDPSFCAYVTDENGLILNHSEIRKALIKGDNLIVKGGLIHNGNPYGGGQNSYLKYMTKNLFRFSSPLISRYGCEYSNPNEIIINLNPKGYKENKLTNNNESKDNNQITDFYINDDIVFWKKPD